MGVPDVKAPKKIPGLQIMANYLIDNNRVNVGCCDWWTKRSKHVGTLELDGFDDELGVDGGMTTFEVIERISNDLRCKCTGPGLLLPRAKFSFWRDGKLVEKHHELPTFSEKV
ncbi:putative pyruvate kinase [Helianthus anomalus]